LIRTGILEKLPTPQILPAQESNQDTTHGMQTFFGSVKKRSASSPGKLSGPMENESALF